MHACQRRVTGIGLAALLISVAVQAAPAPVPTPAPRPAPRVTPLTKGPWLQHPRQDSITVMWETRLPVRGTLRYALLSAPKADRSAEKTIVAPKPQMIHRITLTGLTPLTRYRYAVQDAMKRWHPGTFRTAAARDRPFTFLVYGDCRSNFDRHRSVVEAMLTEGAAFIVNTGDFVEDGAKPRLWRWFFRAEQPLLRHLAMYPVLGNHELKSSWNRGIAAVRRHFAVPPNGPQTGITYSFVHGNSLFLVLNSNGSFVGTRQTAWATRLIQEASTNRRIRHIFAFLHHSPYASGIHGENADLLVSGLVRTMAQHGVDMTFAGHDHVYERGESEGLRYVVSGGCGAPLYPRRKIHAYTRWFESTAHYVRVNVSGDEVELTSLRPDGSIIDNVQYAKRFDDAQPRRRPRFVTLKDAHPRPMPPPKPTLRPPHRDAPKKSHRWLTLLFAFGILALGVLAVLLGNRIRGGRADRD